MITLLALCTFLLILSNLCLWIKVYKLENKTEHDTIMKFIKWVQKNMPKILMRWKNERNT